MIEPVTGWRAWALARAPDGRPELRPIVYSGETWPVSEMAHARCPPTGSSAHDAPDPDCTCGLYAVDALERVPAITGRDVTVIGSVSLWGRVLEHESGFRAELGYPQRLRLVCGPCWHSGAFAPDVVGVGRTSRGALLALCERHARGTSRSNGSSRRLEDELVTAYAVDVVSDAALAPLYGAWRHPIRRARPTAPRISIDTAAMAVLFFGLLVGLYALAISVH